MSEKTDKEQVDEVLGKLADAAEQLLKDREELKKKLAEPAREPRGQGPLTKQGSNSGALSIADSVALLLHHAERGIPLDRATWKKIGFDRQ